MVQKVKCTNPKSYSITKGNEYIILKETRDYYYIENDNNKTSKYSKSLFNKVKEEKVAPVAPVVEKPKDLTVEEILELVTTSADINDSQIDCDITFNKDKTSFNASPSCNYTHAHISCGITQVYGINGLVNSIITFTNSFKHLNDNDKIILSTRLFNRLIDIIKQELSCIIILSTNTNYNYFNIVETVLDEQADSFTNAHNTNSDNDIRMWTIVRP